MRRPRGFTVIEMLACIAVIMVIMAIILSAASQARATARNTHCKSNLQQVGRIVLAYASGSSENKFPPKCGLQGPLYLLGKALSDGLKDCRCENYNGINFDTYVSTTSVATIDAFTDGGNVFSRRYTATITPKTSGVWTFHTRSNDGVRLWVGGQKIIDLWPSHGPNCTWHGPTCPNMHCDKHGSTGCRHDCSGTINLTAGTEYPIQLDYYEYYDHSDVHLYWQPPGGGKVIIPAYQPGATGLTQYIRNPRILECPGTNDNMRGYTGSIGTYNAANPKSSYGFDFIHGLWEPETVAIGGDFCGSNTSQNSANHGSRRPGQNILYVDGHVSWHNKATVGYEKNNVYVAGDTSEYDSVLGQ